MIMEDEEDVFLYSTNAWNSIHMAPADKIWSVHMYKKILYI